MVGACMTVIVLFQFGELRNLAPAADNALAVDALLFLVACGTSYFAIRTKEQEKRDRIERFADWIFLLALCIMAGVCFIVAYELI